MINVKDFKTATVMMDADNVLPDGYWPMGIDYGFSSTVGFGPNHDFSFPSFAKELNANFIIEVNEPEDIQYKDENGNVWAVGQYAQNMAKQSDVSDTLVTTCGRNRYNTPMFKVLIRTGLALAMKEKSDRTLDSRIPMLVTGLPALYVKEDSIKLKKSISGEHEFDIKIGNGPWTHYSFKILTENIIVIPQPISALFSSICKKDGNFIENADKILTSNTLIFDGGHGTFDAALISLNQIEPEYMYTDEKFGMKIVLSKTIDKIHKKSGVYYPPQAFQKCLSDGYYIEFDEDTLASTPVPFDDILEESSKEVCMAMLKKSKEIYNSFRDIDNIILAGGTCAAWENYIRDFLKAKEDTMVISSNENESLPMYFSIARGYYMYLLQKLKG